MVECQFNILPSASVSVGENPRKGLVVFPGALGDFLCFLPTLRFLSELKHDFELEIAMRADFLELLFHRDRPLTVRSLDCHEIGRVFSDRAVLNPGLWNHFRTYSLIYSWMGSGQPDFVRKLESRYDGDLKIFPFRPSRVGLHMVDYYLSCLGGRRSAGDFPDIPLSPSAVAWCRRLWEEFGLGGKKVLALAPGSGAVEKNWPLTYYGALCEWWKEKSNGEALVVLGPAEEERMRGNRFPGNVISVSGLSLGQVVALLSRCDLYLGNDSGITHLAGTLGIPTVALFGPTDTIQWRPLGPRVRALTMGLDCSPCDRMTMRTCADRRCLNAIRPEDVVLHLEEIISVGFLDKKG